MRHENDIHIDKIAMITHAATDAATSGRPPAVRIDDHVRHADIHGDAFVAIAGTHLFERRSAMTPKGRPVRRHSEACFNHFGDCRAVTAPPQTTDIL